MTFEVTPELVAEHGLSEAEYARILEILGRPPNLVELGVFSVMWSYRCPGRARRACAKRWSRLPA